MTDDMLGPSPMHIKYSSYVYDGFCIQRTNFPGPIESVISKFTCICLLDLSHIYSCHLSAMVRMSLPQHQHKYLSTSMIFQVTGTEICFLKGCIFVVYNTP